ncbi:TPA: hypothetical protein EYP44_00695 [Candidatus Bathyarchaeota archaeon]|nr:hypothetical protein [Candidatus Bathyarchaeota archaeon]
MVSDAVTVVLPERVLRVLKERSESEGKTIDEIIGDALLEQFNVSDPEARVELHLKLSEKYLKEAEAFLDKADYVQASEKAWGAAAQMLKAVAYARERRRLTSHRELWEYASRVSREFGEPELMRLWRTAISLHVNFYESWAPAEDVEQAIGDVHELIKRLRGLI